MSDAAIGLAAGTAAEPYLELDRPRAIADHGSPDRVVSIDCDAPDAERWTLVTQRVSPEQRDEIRALAERFAALLGGSSPMSSHRTGRGRFPASEASRW